MPRHDFIAGRADYYQVRVLIQAVYGSLPSPANLRIWGKSEKRCCALCFGGGSLKHNLSSCPKALAEGRYCWPDDQVLKAVAETVASSITTSKYHHPKKIITFVMPGEKSTLWPRSATDLLATATDRQLKVDPWKAALVFRTHHLKKSLSIMIIFSDSTKQVIMVELAVPWEECMDEAQEQKRAKYQELTEQCRRLGWISRCEPIVVGCRGFGGRSLCRVMTTLAMVGQVKKRPIKSVTNATERATRWLWLKRETSWSNATGLQAGD